MEKLTIIFLNKNTDFKKIFAETLQSDDTIFEIRYEENIYPKDQLIILTNMLISREKKVILEIKDADILKYINPTAIFLTGNTPELNLINILKSTKIRALFRITTEKDIEIAKNLSRLFPNLAIVVRTDYIDPLKVGIPNALYLDLPVCLSINNNLKTSLKALNDVKGFIDYKGRYNASKKEFISSYIKKKDPCTKCTLFSKCFGWNKTNKFIPNEIQKITENLPFTYNQILEEISNIPDINIIDFDPRDPDSITTNDVNILQNCRVNRNFNGDNFYHVFNFQHSMYFNRHLENLPSIFNWDDRGLPSLDFKFIGSDNPTLLFKLKQDLLLPEHGVMVLSKIKFDKDWTEEKQQNLDNLTLNTVKNLVRKYGDSDKLEHIGNDLLYKGKKFAGQEWLYIKNIGYIENTVITCDYDAEKEWFDKLYHFKGEKKITGITNEIPELTKDIIIEKLHEAAINLIK